MDTPVTKKELHSAIDTAVSVIRQDIKEFNQQVNSRFAVQDKKLDGLKDDIEVVRDDVSKIKLAVVDLMGTDKHLHNLVRELKGQDIDINEAKVFTT